MFDLKVCTVCLQMDVKCFSLNTNSQLRKDYNLISGLQNCNRNGLPEYLCYLCTAYVQSYKRFRDRCQRAYCVLTEILQRNKQITKPIIKEIDCDALKIGPTLSFLNNNRVKTKTTSVKKWMQECRNSIEQHKSTSSEQYRRLVDSLVFENNPSITIKAENTISNNSVDLTKKESHNDTENTNAVDLFDQDFDGMDQDFDIDVDEESEPVVSTNLDEALLDLDFAEMVPLSVAEAKAVLELNELILINQGRHKCEVCKRSFQSEKRLEAHKRMHDKHVSGTWLCELCNYYYKSEFLLRTHITDKHMYKYLCKMCPEVSFDRLTAKRHYMWTHLHKKPLRKAKNSGLVSSKLALKGPAKGQARAKWMHTKNVKKEIQPVKKKSRKHPDDYLIYSPISQEEQYAIVRDRQNTKNFTDSPFKCEYCFKGFREIMTFTKHLQKHDPAVSGNLQCDMCKIYCPTARKMYKHMNITHLFKYTCQVCAFVCYNRGQAMMHYRYHKNVTYSCEHCEKVFTKASTRLTHIRIKHPSTFICNMCGHSFVSENGLHCHKKLAHRQEVEEDKGEVDTSDPLYCAECEIQFRDDAAFATHFGSSNKHADTNLSIKPVRTKSERTRGRPPTRRDRSSDIVNNGVATATNCEICQKFLATDVQARKHYEAEHPGADYLKRYMCDICGHTTKQYANLTVHMRTHTQEKPYACPHCERRFSMPSNRDRHLVVHTGEKRYQCQHCNRRFTQSSAVKLHIQTVHLKIPYAPWDKKNRKRRRETEVAPLPPPPPPPQRILIDTGSDYVSAYITYNP